MKQKLLVHIWAIMAFFFIFQSVSAQEKYYRRITKQEQKREFNPKPCEFVWNPIGEQLICDMTIDYQNAIFIANLNDIEGEEKAEMQKWITNYPTEFGIRSTQVAVITAIDQLESSFDLIKDTIIPSGLKQDGFFYDPSNKPEEDSLMQDLRQDPTSTADYKGKYYEVWHYQTDSSGAKLAIVFTPLGLEKINILHREEANIKVDYSELKNTFSNAEGQRKDIQQAKKEHPLDYGLFLGEDYFWTISDTWRDIRVRPTLTPEEQAAATKKK